MIDISLNSSSEGQQLEESVQIVHEPPAKKTRGPAAIYVHREVVDTLEEVKAKAKSAGLKFGKTRNRVSYFNCDDCSYKWKSTITSDYKHCIQQTENGHDHGQRERKGGLATEIKNIIDQKFRGKESTTPTSVRLACTTNGLPSPTVLQIKNRVAYVKRVLIPNDGKLSFHMIEQKVCQILGHEPDLMDFQYIINEANPKKSDFAMIYTSEKLMNEQREQHHAMVDGTFKLVYDGFVVLIFGYSDINRHVHVTAAAIVSSESTNVFKWLFQYFKSNRFCPGEWSPKELMADNSRAISAAVAQVFPQATKRSCYFHVKKAAVKKLEELGVPIDEIKNIKDQISELARHAFEDHFDIAAAALIDSWKSSDIVGVAEFGVYFEEQYILKDKQWFAQAGGGCRTDNGIEACNKWIKNVYVTKSLPLMQAADSIKLYLQQARDKNYGLGENEVNVTPADWVAAFDLKMKTKIRRDPNRQCYYVRRFDSTLDNDAYTDFLDSMDLLQWDDNDVATFQENVAVVAPCKLYQNEYTCNCPVGVRRKLCKHALLVKVLITKQPFPNIAAMRQSLNDCGRNKRGRPRKFTPALSKD